ncbi:hypothetical protein D1006_34425 [Burkholderia stabilis]|uniref:Uncharacterized protein n=1 Tax=Burkholderia stabilis TaxID=95485 RepID=A0A4Q2A853_9BURK|nr:hypothetical protein [Burkholderia stabilis]RXV65235.1 hypothetical protein D1006_34425 [Burkholderia stabilis]
MVQLALPYCNQHALLFQCLDVLQLRSNSPDRAVLVALARLQGFWNANREYLLLTENEFVKALSPLDCIDELLTFVTLLLQCLLLKHAVCIGVGTAYEAKSLAFPLIHLQGDVFQ